MYYVWHVERRGSDQGDPGLFVSEEVAGGLRRMGTNALPRLIAELVQTGTSDEAQVRRENAAFALGVVGTNAVAAIPALLKALNDKGIWLRPIAITALGGIHGDPKTVVPILCAMVNHPSRYGNFRGYASHQMAVVALGDYGPEARCAIPALRQTLKDPNPLFAKQAAEALEKIERHGTPAAPANGR